MGRSLMKDPVEWTPQDVVAWLQWLGLPSAGKHLRHFSGEGLLELVSSGGKRRDGTIDRAWRKLTIGERETLQEAALPLLQYNRNDHQEHEEQHQEHVCDHANEHDNDDVVYNGNAGRNGNAGSTCAPS